MSADDSNFIVFLFLSFLSSLFVLLINFSLLMWLYFPICTVPMLPLSGKERRKYLEALKEKNASGEHIASDPAGVILRKAARKRDHVSSSDPATGEVDIIAEKKAEGEEAVDEVHDLTVSPQAKKKKTTRKGGGRALSVEAEMAFETSLWHRDFNYRQYMEEHVPFSAVDKDAAFHGKFDELVQDVGTSALRTLCYIQSMEKKYEALEKEYQNSVKDVEKFKHKATTFEERVEGLLKDKAVLEKNIADAEKEKTVWEEEKKNLETQNAKLQGDLVKSQDEVENGKMALVSYFEDGFERAKSQTLHFYPDLDLSGLNSLMIVQDGELVEEP